MLLKSKVSLMPEDLRLAMFEANERLTEIGQRSLPARQHLEEALALHYRLFGVLSEAQERH